MTNPHPPPSSSSSSSTSFLLSSVDSSNPSDHLEDMRFGRFVIPKASIFSRTALSAAFVNLRPIVPGHVLIMPQRIVPLMADLTTEEYTDMWLLVRQVQGMLQRHYNATAFNVAVQDGRAAGQSVPHVHVHILPRTKGDFQRNDDIYEALEEWAPRIDMVKERTSIDVPDDKDRVDRTLDMMAEEAATYRRLLEQSTR
ncbi:HIT-like domain containing protein [Nitzschia inconspicua]|uniref:Bis(5'-adenosyl)-triphosphatase n=1 Tax=Nitzschia inconspicua TaxID=303405 RepID=A0A9K3M6A0_9STRA|nr:HIT-like domain containing protein [Nitzschia inconspicua]